MAIELECPSCGAKGRASEEAAGRQVRCKHCRFEFTIPRPDEPESMVYELAEPHPVETGAAPNASTRIEATPPSAERASTFRPTYHEPPSEPPAPEGFGMSGPKALRRSHAALPELAHRMLKTLPWIFGVGLAVGLLGLITPIGAVWIGRLLLAAGFVMVGIGFGAGAYGAFSEDLVNGFAYVFFPIYTGYYWVSRWDDIWPWFLWSTAGMVLFSFGGLVVEAAG